MGDKTESSNFSWAAHLNVECVRHLHPHFEIIEVIEGQLNMRVGNSDYAIPAGQGIFVSAFEPHEFHSPQYNRCRVLMFSSDLVPTFCEALRGKLTSSHIFAVSDGSRAVADSILVGEGGRLDTLEAQALLYPVCLDALRGCAFEEGKRLLDSSTERAFDYMSAHIAESISLDGVARAVGLHPVTLSKMFSKKMGVGFNDCVIYLRCRRAAHLIKNSGATFTEIAYACGFGSVRSFNRSFRAVYGTTPSEYREGNVSFD